MNFISTRGQCEPVGFCEAVARGLAPDGGLYLPEKLPDLSSFLPEWKTLSYPELCYAFMRQFATDLPAEVLQEAVDTAYAGFSHEHIAPVRKLDDQCYVCELFHGPTLAFKDFALQLLGQLYAYQIRSSGHPITVLGATSGDTGSAAIHGLMNLPGMRLFILYPKTGVAPLQERQMACTGSDNVFPIAIDGSFDDAQKWVKSLFGDTAFKEQYHLSAINSINLARVLAQCVYYLYAWFRIPEADHSRLEVVVPTGNFGNVLAGWLLTHMGVDIPHFRIATNQNDILYRLFESGVYAVDAVQPSLAPSMDIQVASNFERFLHYRLNGDAARLREIMSTFLQSGRFEFPEFATDRFSATRSDDASILRNITTVYERFGYVIDPHTACAFEQPHPERVQLIMATAHPAKFPDAIHRAIGIDITHPTLDALKDLPVQRYELENQVESIRAFIKARIEASAR